MNLWNHLWDYNEISKEFICNPEMFSLTDITFVKETYLQTYCITILPIFKKQSDVGDCAFSTNRKAIFLKAVVCEATKQNCRKKPQLWGSFVFCGN